MNTRYNETILDDIKAYVDWAEDHGTSTEEILCNIAHDCDGLLRDEVCFSPRVERCGSQGGLLQWLGDVADNLQ